jgi:GTPase SAR1 family protein
MSFFAKKDEKEINKRISQAQVQAELANQSAVKLLILGAGGSGKTTLRKQFQRLYANGFKEAPSRMELAGVIRFNLLEGARAIVTASFDDTISGGGLTDGNSLAAAALLNNLPEGCTVIDDATAGAIKTLWRDPVYQKTTSNSSKFQLQECVIPFMQECQDYPNWGGQKWVPSIDDCVRSRIRSSGIIEVEFDYEGTKFKVFDAGGQRAERRKWIHAFESVTALIFLASLTEYDEVLYEDQTKNRLQESLEVWSDIVNNASFVVRCGVESAHVLANPPTKTGHSRAPLPQQDGSLH